MTDSPRYTLILEPVMARRDVTRADARNEAISHANA
jgi:hypothetical protein